MPLRSCAAHTIRWFKDSESAEFGKVIVRGEELDDPGILTGGVEHIGVSVLHVVDKAANS